jgi:hypothetical protein
VGGRWERPWIARAQLREGRASRVVSERISLRFFLPRSPSLRLDFFARYRLRCVVACKIKSCVLTKVRIADGLEKMGG